MSRRNPRDTGYRERWIDAVLWNGDLKPITKVVLIAMSRYMDDRGHIKRKHSDIAADVQIKNPKHIGDRIREARDAGFLSHVAGTGRNRTTTQYDAMIPALERGFAPRSQEAQVPRNGGPENGGLEPRSDAPFRSLKTGDHYARALEEPNREQVPAPDGSRVEREHDETSQALDYWKDPATRRNRPGPVLETGAA